MKAVAITAFGGPEVLQEVERAVPAPGPHDVLVRVDAAGVNRPDIMQRLGKYPPPPGASDLPGLEIAGVVAAIGTDVRRWREGDRVCALVAGGGYAEYCLTPQPQYVVRAADGRSVARVDLAFPEHLVAVEYDVEA